ncbi:MAG: fused MFS/spermidine synthase [Anaerolineae bacterium]
MTSQNLTASLPSTTLKNVGHLALSRVLHMPRLIVFLSGINLILVQWVLVREMTALLLGTELVVLLVTAAYFVGLSLGYVVANRMRRSWLKPIALATLGVHLGLPIWFRLLVAWFDSISAYWAAFVVLPLLTPFLISAFYSVFLPLFADNSEATLPQLYASEVMGSGAGVLVLVVLGAAGLPAVYLVYSLCLLAIVSALGLSWRWTSLAAVLCAIWLALLPEASARSNARWYEQLHELPRGTTTLLSTYSPYQKVDVLQDPQGQRYLYLDGLLHFGTASWSRLNVLMGSVPADLLHPQQSLVVGAGSMELERFIAERGGQVTTVELDPVVVEASSRYLSEYNRINELTNRTIVVDDAKHFMATTDQQFDLIATDVPAAFAIQTATLYSVPFYEQIAKRLSPDGVLVVNLTTRLRPDRMVSRRIMASLLATFTDVYVVTSESSRLSYAYVGNHLPFDSLQLSDALRQQGEQDFIIFERQAAEAIVGDARPITLDSMDLVLEISARWIGDRLQWN